MSDAINPSHYKDGYSNGAEVIDITENLNFNRGNAVKYIARAGKKDPTTEIQDLRKAKWYIERELERLGKPSISIDNRAAAQQKAVHYGR
ncbi:DUF3310 domain-containing protein [Mycobacteroides abscessus]|uniref:DUF3310 domain-containing protein n=1 Tax=Mycobacteroides abscessus TaxID=36809 RepID=UPI0009A6F1C6|nr:DUF3310 domain-containing protein [Mycobacteroides abscessus]SKS41982.1 Protein of unknwon function (DUF3310) [Mycobacteroides abscessus subsp. bolletii]